MSQPKPEKSKNFESQIEQQLQAMDLSPAVLEEQDLEVGRVSEIVGESPVENKNSQPTKAKPKKGLKSITQQVAGMLSGGKPVVRNKKLPTPAAQKVQVRKALEKRTKKLVAQATKMQRSSNYSASSLEKVLLEIRHLQEILSELVQVTVDRMEELYRRYVLRQQ